MLEVESKQRQHFFGEPKKTGTGESSPGAGFG